MSIDTLEDGDVPSSIAGPRQWLGLVILALPCLLYSMDLTVLNLAVPHITADLRPTGTQLLWIVDIYGFLLAGALVTMGAIGDRLGRRRLLFIGAVAFAVASTIAAFSTSAWMLIAARALLGLAAATVAPSTLSLIRTMFEDGRQRSVAIGIWMASFSLGGAIGPLVGGLLLEYFWWGSVFLISIPVMVGLLVVGPFLLPEHRDPSSGRIDPSSVLLSILAILALIYGIKHLAVGDIGVITFGSLMLGVWSGWAFIRRQHRLSAPLIDLDLFRSEGFTQALLVNLAGFFLAFGTLLFLSQYLQLVLDMGSFEAGLWTLFSAAGFVSGSVFAPSLLRWMRASSVMGSSLIVSAIGFAVLASALHFEIFGLLMIGSFLFAIGLAPVFTLSADTIVGAVPERKAGSAAAIAETSSELGGALGIALLGSLLTSLYQYRVEASRALVLSENARSAIADGISNAVAHLDQLPSDPAETLRPIVFSSYVDALTLVTIASSVIAIIASATAYRILDR